MPTAPKPKRILLIRLGALGDVLLATPLLRALRAAYPAAHIDWLVDGRLRPLLSENRRLTRALSETPGGLRALRERRYDLAIDLQNKPKTVWLRTRLRPRRLLVLRKRTIWRGVRSLAGLDAPERGPSAVRRNLSLLEHLGVPAQGEELDLAIPPLGATEAAPLFRGAMDRPLGLAPGGSWATKRWPHFPALAQRLAERQPILGLGGPDDAEALDALRAAAGPSYLGDTRDLSVAGLAAAIAGCRAIVTNDSGPAHIAAAVGTPELVLFGPTSAERWRPPGPLVSVLDRDLACSPCSNHGSARCPLGTHACLRELSVDLVERKALACIEATTHPEAR